MAIEQQEIDKIQKLLEITREGIGKKDFIQSFEAVVAFVTRMFATLTNRIDSQVQAKLKEVDDKVATIRDGKDGKDGPRGPKGDSIKGEQGEPGQDGKNADPAAVVPLVIEKIGPLQNLNGEDIRNNLEALSGKDRLNASAIEGLEQLVKKEVAARPVSTGGGVTNMRIIQAFKYILKTEQPTGTIDGVTTTYTVSQPIFAVLGMSINGETIAQLPNYTINDKSIIFSSPLPSDYSGKDFEIKYI